MAAYDNCSVCDAKGTLECKACFCGYCRGTGQVSSKCPKCEAGQAPCGACGTTGRVVAKKGWFSETYGACGQCGGSGRRRCSSCNDGNIAAQCRHCLGSGRDIVCTLCGGSLKVKCSNCGGAGKFESEWLKSLPTLPIDRLKFEINERERQIEEVRREIFKVESDYAGLIHYWKYEAQNLPNVHWGAQASAMAPYNEKKGKLARRIDELEAEREVIKQVLVSKWK